MESPSDRNSNTEFPSAQQESFPRRYRDARKPSRVFALLSLSEIERGYGLYEQKVYAMVARGLLHPVRVGGRIKYLEFEVQAAVVKGRYPIRFEFGPTLSPSPLAA